MLPKTSGNSHRQVEDIEDLQMEDPQMPVACSYVFSGVIQFLQRKIPNRLFGGSTPAFVKIANRRE